MIEDLIRFCRVFAKYNPLDCSKIRKDLNDVEPEIIEEMIIPYANDCYIYGMAFGLMKTMLDTKNLSPEVQSLKDVLGSNYCFLYDKQGRFVTSDTPLINIHNKLIPDLSTVDYICLPLTSSCCIAFCDDDKLNGQVFTLSKKQIDIINQAHFSKRYGLVIANSEDVISKCTL
jgi:hypothetical protein